MISAMKEKNKCTLKDVAERAGVAVYTVSRALNGKKDVSDALREKIQKIAAEMGYVPNSGARILREGCSKTVGVVYDDIRNPFYQILTSMLAEKLHKKGYQVIIFYDFDSISQLHEKLMVRVLSANVDGIISLINPDDDALALNKIWKKPLAVVTSSDKSGNMDIFQADDFGGGVMAAEYLIAEGYKKIGYINASTKHYSGMRRYEGYKKAHEDAGLTVDDSLFISLQDTGLTIKQSAERLIELGTDAIFCFNDVTALAVLCDLRKEVEEKGIKVVGFDGIQQHFTLPLTLTTLQVDFEGMSRDAVDALIDKIENGTLKNINKVYPVKLLKGDT